MKHYLLLVLFLLTPLVQVHATAFYTDFTNGLDSNDGLATTTGHAWQSVGKFMGNARTSGDILFVRRGMASTTNGANITITSAGTVTNPLTVEADYDNLWSDFATSSQTYTATVGSTTLTASSNTDITAGKWVYLQGDCFEKYSTTIFNDCQYAYEVVGVSGTFVELRLPYQGTHAGSGNNLRIMPSAPQQGFSGNALNQLSAGSSINNWIIKGMDWRSTTFFTCTSGRCIGYLFFDDILDSNNSIINQNAIFGGIAASFVKDRIGTSTVNFFTFQSDGFLKLYVDQTKFLFNSGAFIGTIGNNHMLASNIKITNSFFNRLVTFFTTQGSAGGTALDSNISIQNTWMDNSKIPVFNNFNSSTGEIGNLNIENLISTTTSYSIGYNSFADAFLSTSATVPMMESTSSPALIRSGGGPVSIRVLPVTNLAASSTNPQRYIQLFDYPIYTDTSAKTYSMYFMATSTAGWTKSPTAKELYIQCTALGPTINNATTTWQIIKSTGTVDFTGSTAYQPLSTTCTPAQSGILHLQGFYGKTQESGKMNEFYVDGTPVIQ